MLENHGHPSERCVAACHTQEEIDGVSNRAIRVPLSQWWLAKERCDGGLWNQFVDGLVGLSMLTKSFKTNCK